MNTRADLTPIRTILFDWGGTLCDISREPASHVACAQRAAAWCREQDWHVPAAAAGQLFQLHLQRLTRCGKSPDYLEYDVHNTLADWLEQLRLTPAATSGHLDRLVGTFWQGWLGCLDLFDGVLDALGTLSSRGYVLGLLSNVATPPDICDAELARLGIRQHLSFAEFSSRTGCRKPHPAAYEAALAAARLTLPDLVPEQILFVGDLPEPDVAGPARMGMRTALIGTAEAYPHLPPDLRLARVADLPHYLPPRD